MSPGIRHNIIETCMIPSDRIDADPYLLACANGVVDLRLGELRPGEPKDYITKSSPVEWQDLHAPAPAWEQGEYGGQFWLNAQGEDGLPTDAYSARGVDGQRTFIVPSHDLVIVRMGHRTGGATFNDNLTQANRQIIEALG